MNIPSIYHRLRIVSKTSLLKVLFQKIRSQIYATYEKVAYASPAPPVRNKKLSRINLVHGDVFADRFPELFKHEFPSCYENILKRAALYLEGTHDLLGSGPFHFGQEIPWNKDFKSGFEWNSKTFFTKIRFGKEGTDVKIPWELSRCSHFIVLGQAYALTKDEKFTSEFIRQFDDWIDKNPVKFGVNWKSSMDVALRAANWLLAWDFFSQSPTINEDFRVRFTSSLWEHGLHIYRHQEYGGNISTNHYVSNLLGLYYIGIALNEEKWKSFAIESFKKQILAQTMEDGFNYEASTAYHRLVLEIFFYFSLLNSKNQQTDLGSLFNGRLEEMFQVLSTLTNQEGRMPLIGDNDSGRIHEFNLREDHDTGFLIQLGAIFFEINGWNITNWPAPSESVWLFGWDGFEALKKTNGTPTSERLSRPPRKNGSGLISLRGADDHLVVSAQPNGIHGVGNHTHNDKLSFTLSIKGDDFFVDPGSAAYLSDLSLRNQMRSTRFHNTVEIDHEEQNRFIPGAPFALNNDASVKIINWKDNSFLTAKHNGYARLNGNVIHQRRFERFLNPSLHWEIEDTIGGLGLHHVCATFILSAHVTAEIKDATIRLTGRFGILEMKTGGTDGFIWLMEGAVISPAYGLTQPSQALRYSGEVKLPTKLVFDLQWRPKDFS